MSAWTRIEICHTIHFAANNICQLQSRLHPSLPELLTVYIKLQCKKFTFSLPVTVMHKIPNMTTRIPDLISKKRDKNSLTEEEFHTFTEKLVKNNVDQCQLGAFMMAIYLNGMTDTETAALTKAMVRSGRTFNWPQKWKHLVVDKHSTGGVGDKISPILVPAIAACGLKVPMISGRALGITGGTLDKLEAIPGFQVSCDIEQIEKCLDTVGCCIAGQTDDIVPADRTMYLCRDVTSTVNSIPLIVSSIMSKKLAEGLSGLILDVKYGSATFMDTIEKAEHLANRLVSTGKMNGVATSAFITKMDWPIGCYIGNALEIFEVVQALNGIMTDDIKELVVKFGSHLLLQAKLAENSEQGEKLVMAAIDNGAAKHTFQRMLVMQGVNEQLAEDVCKLDKIWTVLPRSKHTTQLKYTGATAGYVQDLHAVQLAQVSIRLGSGRNSAEDSINYAVGISLDVQVGSPIQPGQSWVTIHHDGTIDQYIEDLNKAIVVGPDPVPREKLIRIHKVIS